MITITQESVNDSTVLAAPPEAVKEIGRVLPWLLHYMRDTPEGLHILFSKLDISNGFWQLIVQEADSQLRVRAPATSWQAGEDCSAVGSVDGMG